jgi:ubiquinone/menaquinone biosynthesis C-methylase UbiE
VKDESVSEDDKGMGVPGWNLFDQVADTYDAHFLTTREPARRLIAFAGLASGERVLEVGAGTGFATFLAADAVGAFGSVLATDVAEQMLAVARAKAARDGVDNVAFETADGMALTFPDGTFDRVFANCVLIGFPDVGKALREWRRVVRPGGTVAFTSFAREGTEFPMQRPEAVAVLDRYLGDRPRALPPHAVDSAEKCAEQLRGAGFEDVEVEQLDLGYTYPDFDTCWNEWWASLFRLRFAHLDAARIAKLKDEVAAALAPAFADGGLYRANMTVLARGRKPT